MFESIQKELRKPAHYLSMHKREQAANHIDKLQAALNQYSEDEILLTHQSTIANQSKQIEALTQLIVERDLILKQYLSQPAASVAQAEPLSDFKVMQIIGQQFPLPLVEPKVIKLIESVCRGIETAHGIKPPIGAQE